MRSWLGLFFAVMAADPALADPIPNPDESWLIPLNARFDAPGPHPGREDHGIYKVSFTCTKLKELPRKDVFKSLIGKKKVTTSHSILFSKSLINPDATSGKLTLPNDAFRLITPYAINGNNIVDQRNLCFDPFIITGTQSLYLYPIVSYSTSYEPGFIAQLGFSLLKLVPIVWSVFEPISAAVNEKVGSAKQIEEPLRALFSNFNEDDTYSKPFQITTGRYEIVTDYSRIVVTVARIPSLVKEKPTSLQEAFRAQLATAAEQVKPDDISASCNVIAAKWKEVGFSEDSDIPYALTYLASHTGSKGKMLECLGSSYREAAVNLGPLLWAWIPAPLKIDKHHLEVLQPSSFAEAKKSLYQLIIGLSWISKGDPKRASDGLAKLKVSTSGKLTLSDETPDSAVGGSGVFSAEDLAKNLIQRGYRRFGCMAAVVEDNGLNVDDAVASFLIINASTDANSAARDAVLHAHVFFQSGTLTSELKVYREDKWIKYNVDKNEGNCNGFKITEPAQASRQEGRFASQ